MTRIAFLALLYLLVLGVMDLAAMQAPVSGVPAEVPHLLAK